MVDKVVWIRWHSFIFAKIDFAQSKYPCIRKNSDVLCQQTKWQKKMTGTVFDFEAAKVIADNHKQIKIKVL